MKSAGSSNWPADATRKVASHTPVSNPHRVDRQVLHRKIAGFAINEQYAARIDGTQEGCLADAGRADNQGLYTAAFGETFVGADNFHE